MRHGLGLGVQTRSRGFLPTDLRPVICLDARQGITEDVGVSQWRNLMGGVNVQQSADTSQPAFNASGLNGRPTVDFDGSNDFLEALDDASIQDLFVGGASIFVAGAITSAVVFSRLVFKRSVTGWTFDTGDAGNALRLFHDFTTNDGWWQSDATFAVDGSPSLLECHYDSSDVNNDPEFVINSSVSAVTEGMTPSGVASADTGPMWIGGDNGGSNTSSLRGMFVIIFPRILLELERTMVRKFIDEPIGLSL